MLQDPHFQFVVEADASDIGIGVVLSQRSPLDNKLHPCSIPVPEIFTCDVDYRELLAVKVALGKAWHGLEGAEQSLLVWTDHKNLEYIWIAKQLNARQATWELFFNRFNFTLAYCPGSKNIKPDSLPHQFDSYSFCRSSTNILPSSCVMGAVTWGI